MTILDTLRRRDPDLLNLRKATRATIVAFPIFAVLNYGLGQGLVAAYAFFACLVPLVFADFGGPLRPRSLAYTVVVVIGAFLVLIGSLLTGHLFGGAVGMFVFVFAVSFASIFGGYAPAFVAPLALAYSLSVLSPLREVAIDARLLGWMIGGGAALVAAIVLWPVDQRLKLRQTLAKASTGLAKALESLPDRDAAEAAYREASDAMATARQKASTPLRPAGPTSRRIGLLHLVADLEQAFDVTREIVASGWLPPEDKEIGAACAHALRQAGAVLTEESPPNVVAEGTKRLDEARLARRQTADTDAIGATAPRPDREKRAAEGLAIVRRSAPIMALSHLAIWIAADAATAAGDSSAIAPVESAPELSPPTDRPGDVVIRAERILSSGLDPDGVIFRNSIRAAAAMTLAVVLAQTISVAHGFWITLGALLVLRSSASSTSATALQAIAGTTAGFAVSAVVLWLFGHQDAILWTLLPFAMFFAAYAPGAVGFFSGQVSFTVMMVVLFTLIENVGISTSIARLETVTIGAAASAMMSLILWPRGARVALARSVAALYRAAGAAARTPVTAPEEERETQRNRMRRARRRADEAFGVALNERGLAIDTRAWLTLARAPNLVDSLAGGLLRQPSPSLVDRCGTAIGAVADLRNAVAGRLDEVADRLDPNGAVPLPPRSAKEPADLEAKLLRCFELSGSYGPAGVEDALALIAWNEHLTRVGTYIDEADADLGRVARASQPRAWLYWLAPTHRHYDKSGEVGAGKSA